MKKKFILAMVVFLTANYSFAQICTTEDFSQNGNNWTFSQGARLGNYNNPRNSCSDERGIITPGVGGNNPCNIKTPSYTSSGANTVQITFDILCFNANLKCNTWKDFDCETSVDVFYFVGTNKYTGITDLVLPPNGPTGNSTVTFSMPVGSNLPAGTNYQVQFEFKPKSGIGQCVQQNTKYVLDNFRFCESGGISRTAIGNTFPKQTEELNNFTISPNPSNGSTELKIKTTINYDQIEIIDNSGRVFQTAKNNPSGILNIKGLQKGFYFIRLTKHDSGEFITKRILVN